MTNLNLVKLLNLVTSLKKVNDLPSTGTADHLGLLVTGLTFVATAIASMTLKKKEDFKQHERSSQTRLDLFVSASLILVLF